MINRERGEGTEQNGAEQKGQRASPKTEKAKKLKKSFAKRFQVYLFFFDFEFHFLEAFGAFGVVVVAVASTLIFYFGFLIIFCKKKKFLLIFFVCSFFCLLLFKRKRTEQQQNTKQNVVSRCGAARRFAYQSMDYAMR